MRRLLLWLYLKLFRSWSSPLLYWIFRIYAFRNAIFPYKWEKIKKYNIDKFSRILAEYDYYSDYINGYMDFSPREKNYYFHSKKAGRDCDDWARMWYWYFQEQNIKVYEIALINLDNLMGHMVTVAKIEGEYQLFDYRPVDKKGKSIEKVLQYNNVNYNNFIWAVNKKYI